MLCGSAGKTVVYMTNSTDTSLEEKPAKVSTYTQKATAWIYAINTYYLPHPKFLPLQPASNWIMITISCK